MPPLVIAPGLIATVILHRPKISDPQNDQLLAKARRRS
jgi:hypothetical protein